MTNTPNYQKHLLYIYKNLFDLHTLPFDARVKPIQKLITYLKNNISNEDIETIYQVSEAKTDLYYALSEAMHLESSSNLLYSAFAKARDQLRHDPTKFEGLDEIMEQIPCKSSSETLVRLLAEDKISIEHLVQLHLAEHYTILHPEELNRSKKLFDWTFL